MRKTVIFLCLILTVLGLFILFNLISNTPIGEFEMIARSFDKSENTQFFKASIQANYVPYYDTTKAKQCIKNEYGRLYPFVNRKTVEKQSEKYLLGYNDNTFALSDGLGNLKEKSFALYGYKKIFDIEKCKESAERFLYENGIQYSTLKKSRLFMGVYYFQYENSDGEIITVGVDTEFCEIKYLNQ